MKKRLLFIVPIVLLLGVLSFPILNLVFPPNTGGFLSNRRSDDPLFARVASVLEKKCVLCHAEKAPLPFYASLPIAKGMIEKDVREGIEALDMAATFSGSGSRPVSEVAVAKLEHTLREGSMPPLRYKLLHWNAGLSDAEKKDLVAWIHDVRRRHHATPGVVPEFQTSIVQALPNKVEGLDPRQVALGKKLFHDPRLSVDNTISCASCHALDRGGTDQKRFSTGVKGAVGDINSPTVFNSGLQVKQFWDGRADTLEQQADGPVNNPVEMGSNWNEVVAKLRKDEALVKEIQALYPQGLSGEAIMHAIATFERSLLTPNSRLDQYLRGRADALVDEEKEGFRLFDSVGCTSCHVGKLLGGQSFEKMGHKKGYFAARGTPVGKADLGRFNVTQKEGDRHKFKVPTLRNITLTAPYFHDGAAPTLKEATRLMGRHQLGKELSDHEVDRLVKFMGTLTGEYEGKLLR
jgi:cytochrome c peroxidase